MAYCYDCERYFQTQHGYHQHMNNSAAHRDQWESESEPEPEYDWECSFCDSAFGARYDLEEHCAGDHLYCLDCERGFRTENGINQHILNSASHRAQREPEPDPEPEYNWGCNHCSFAFISEQVRDQHLVDDHPYCAPCKRMFQNKNNLRQHQHSRVHMGGSIDCPFCKIAFTTASGVIIHLESGSCSSGLNRTQINDAVRRLDRNNVITRPMITMPGHKHKDDEIYATVLSWDGRSYRCYLCSKGFTSLKGLNSHLQSGAHEQPIYRCPKDGCARPFRMLSGLVQHVESEICGLMRFDQVQKQARNGIQNMIGRMIQG